MPQHKQRLSLASKRDYKCFSFVFLCISYFSKRNMFMYIRMLELNNKEGRVLKKWCFRTMVLEKTLESPLEGKEIETVNPKGNQPLIFIERTDAEVEAPTLWPPDVNSRLIGKDPAAGKDCRQEEEGMTEGEMVGWHHWLSGHEFEQAPRDGEAQGSLACCTPWGHKEWYIGTEQHICFISNFLFFLHICRYVYIILIFL